MDARATRRGIPAVVIWGGFCALAWAAFTILVGGGSAHADEQSDGPLDGLTTLVEGAVSSVATPVVSQVVAPVVTHVATPVVQAVAAPVQQAAPAVVATVTQTVAQVPVVGPTTISVVGSVSQAAEGIVDPITDLLTDAPVAQVTDPILDAVTGLPILGGLIDDLGARDLVDAVVGVVDDTTGLIGGVTDETVPPLLGGLEPVQPGTSGSNEPEVSSAPTPVLARTASASSAFAPIPALSTRPVAPAHTPSVVIDERGALGASSDPPSGAPPGAPVSPISFAGPGGGSHSAHARLSEAGASPLRAWERAVGASDDALPASAVADTDNSPD